MSLSISSSPSIHFDQLSSLNVFPTPSMQRIQEIALTTLSRIFVFFSSFNPLPKSNEGNLKTFALVSCLSLVALLVISVLRKRDSQITLTRIRTKPLAARPMSKSKPPSRSINTY